MSELKFRLTTHIPETLLLDNLTYIDDGERDATTAGAARTNGHTIQVTLRIARPPRLSHLAVHCPGQAPDKLPWVVATQDDLALLRVPVPVDLFGNDLQEEFFPYRADARSEFFVYRAGAGDRPPILRMIPDPNTLHYSDKEVGILSCPNAERFVVVLNQSLRHPIRARYIHTFDSETWAWSTKQVCLKVKPSKIFLYTTTSKVVTMGGKRGTMGWVDLWRGILVHDVLRGGGEDDKAELRYVPLPSRPRFAFVKDSAGSFRDVTVVNGVVRYFTMYSRGLQPTCVRGAWHADMWTMTRPWKKWQHRFRFKSSEIELRHSELLRDLGVEKKPVLTSIRAGSPVLSQEEEDVVYMLAKPMFKEEKAWVITIDMNTKTLRAVDEFDAARTVGLMFANNHN